MPDQLHYTKIMIQKIFTFSPQTIATLYPRRALKCHCFDDMFAKLQTKIQETEQDIYNELFDMVNTRLQNYSTTHQLHYYIIAKLKSLLGLDIVFVYYSHYLQTHLLCACFSCVLYILRNLCIIISTRQN